MLICLAKDIENAFFHLLYLAENPEIKYKDLDHISKDPDLEILRLDSRWSGLIATVESNKQEYERYLDKPLVAILDTISVRPGV